MFRPSILGNGETTGFFEKLRRELGQRFVPLPKPSDQELRTAAMMALGKELRLATQQCCGGKGWWAFLRGLGYIDVYIYMIIYVYIFEISNLVRWLLTRVLSFNKGPFFGYPKKPDHSRFLNFFEPPLRYDSVAFQADAEQQLELHGPRLLAAALVPLAEKNLWSNCPKKFAEVTGKSPYFREI